MTLIRYATILYLFVGAMNVQAMEQSQTKTKAQRLCRQKEHASRAEAIPRQLYQQTHAQNNNEGNEVKSITGKKRSLDESVIALNNEMETLLAQNLVAIERDIEEQAGLLLAEDTHNMAGAFGGIDKLNRVLRSLFKCKNLENTDETIYASTFINILTAADPQKREFRSFDAQVQEKLGAIKPLCEENAIGAYREKAINSKTDSLTAHVIDALQRHSSNPPDATIQAGLVSFALTQLKTHTKAPQYFALHAMRAANEQLKKDQAERNKALNEKLEKETPVVWWK